MNQNHKQSVMAPELSTTAPVTPLVSNMASNHLPTEVIQHLYGFLSIHDILSLSCTSKLYHMAYIGHQLSILEQAAHNSYSPISDLVKLVCANEPDMRPRTKLLSSRNRAAAHVSRVINIPDKPKLTLDLIFKMVPYGEVARKWVEIFPRLRWREDAENRRLLRPHEQERLRSAIYHFWTYNSLFHHSPFHPSVIEDSTSLGQSRPWSDDPRLCLLRTYTTVQLIQLAEFYGTTLQLIELDLCPSDTTIMERYPRSLSSKAVQSMGWGESYPYQRLLHVLMKLRPREILHLFEKTSTKSERLEYLLGEGGHLKDTPSTLRHAIEVVTEGRMFSWRGQDEYGRELNWGVIDPLGQEPGVYEFYHLSRDSNPDGAWPYPVGDDGFAADRDIVDDDDESD